MSYSAAIIYTLWHSPDSVGIVDVVGHRRCPRVRGSAPASRLLSQVWLAQAHFYFQFRIQSDTLMA
jgi:hypothetical protein